MKRSLLIKSILEVPVYCNSLHEMNTRSHGSFIKVVTFMRAFCNLIVKSREKCQKAEQLMYIHIQYVVNCSSLFNCWGNLGNYTGLDDINICSYCYYISKGKFVINLQ